jgi:serine phosphatase RsbU (regulator of sigma subunit)
MTNQPPWILGGSVPAVNAGGASADPEDPGRAEALNAGERLVDGMLHDAHTTGPHELAGLISRYAATLGVQDAVAYLVDLQQTVLIPLLEPDGPGPDRQLGPLVIDSTVAGRSFQHVEVLSQREAHGGLRVWLPLLDGAERLGVIGVTVADPAAVDRDGGPLRTRLLRFAAMIAELLMTKTLYGDTLVRLRRRQPVGLAAEIQWALLPPLTFASRQVTIAAALEPAYEVAGDSVDYAVDAGRACLAIFDAMGHGLRSALLAAVAVAAYRNARRAGLPLTATAEAIDTAVATTFGGDAFVTAALAELETDTGLLSWVNAGHPEPLLLRGRQQIKSLHVHPTLPLGLGPAFERSAATIAVGREQLEPGDRVLLHTDGVTDIRSPAGKFFGADALTDLLAANLAAGLPAPETMRRVVRALMAHQQGQLEDDATMLLAEWRSGNHEAVIPS